MKSCVFLARLLGAVSVAIHLCLAFPADPYRLEIRATGSLASFIASESPVALQGILNNIGSSGSLAPGADPGMVVASPSTADPNCT
jgi:glucoamylase